MPKCKTAFFSVTDDKIYNIGDEITQEKFDRLPEGYKGNFDLNDEITVVADQQLLDLNPELEEAGVKVGDEVTFSEVAEAPAEAPADQPKETGE